MPKAQGDWRNKPLSERGRNQTNENQQLEYIFGSMMNEKDGVYFKVIGLERNTVKLGMMSIESIISSTLSRLDMLHIKTLQIIFCLERFLVSRWR